MYTVFRFTAIVFLMMWWFKSSPLSPPGGRTSQHILVYCLHQSLPLQIEGGLNMKRGLQRLRTSLLHCLVINEKQQACEVVELLSSLSTLCGERVPTPAETHNTHDFCLPSTSFSHFNSLLNFGLLPLSILKTPVED